MEKARAALATDGRAADDVGSEKIGEVAREQMPPSGADRARTTSDSATVGQMMRGRGEGVATVRHDLSSSGYRG